MPTPGSRTVCDLRVPGTRRRLALAGGPAERTLIAEIVRHGGRYETPLASVLVRILPRDAVVVDVGAHIGAVALTAAVLAPRGVVHAVEPGAATAARLRENADRNGLRNVRVHELALAAAPGRGVLHGGGFSAGAHLVTGDGRGDDDQAVAVDTLDGLVSRLGLERLDLVKIDVEGAEPALLAGAEGTLARLRPAVVVEVNPPALRRIGGGDAAGLLAALREHLTHVRWIGRGGSLHPVGGAADLVAHLRGRGVGDILCTAAPPPRGGPRAAAGQVLERLRARGGAYAVDGVLAVTPGASPPARLAPGTRTTLPVRLVNGTGTRLTGGGRHPLRVAARWWGAGAAVMEGERAALPAPLPPGGTAELAVPLRAPGEPGRYTVRVAAVHEHHAWLDDLGPDAALTFEVEVGDAA